MATNYDDYHRGTIRPDDSWQDDEYAAKPKMVREEHSPIKWPITTENGKCF